MKIIPTPLEGAYLIELAPIRDERGFFVRTFCGKTLREHGLVEMIAQANHSRTVQRGTIRGLHYQSPPAPEVKIVRCIRGRVFDVFVDVRKGSPTFLQWHGVELSQDTLQMVYVPAGFAHGYQAMCDNCDVTYTVSVPYVPSLEGRLRWDDERIGIDWPLRNAILSPKDAATLPLSREFQGIVL